eukprot:CAMPEP_0198430806 /NCGR_PEP_ID=MMETSP1452-20131203/15757_1 /TAXON_ID=1181717 /ORGANISM="Synchroma pusillum, Strain CCMP3072" /LENGTH=400 /DNA_ID=CAMNT_0044151259 /DNA_START=18 /DNA_END=1218 /DNA_ORIENTATION=-
MMEMGFAELRARKALVFGGNNLEGAITWITEHQDDPDIDEPMPEGAAADAAAAEQQRMMDIAMAAAAESGATVSAEPPRQLTPEEKAAKLAELKAKMAIRRAEREQGDKLSDVERERIRIESGKAMNKTAEELEAAQRKREADARKREKDEFKRERERLRAELERDKAERRARGGKLASKLGVDGYNPSAVQYDRPAEGAEGEAGAEPAAVAAPAPAPAPAVPERTPAEIVDVSIEKLKRYRVGGDGGVALRTLKKLIENVANNPAEPRFRAINLDNRAIKQKVTSLVGGLALLKACGFAKDPEENRLVMPDEAAVDGAFLSATVAKLAQAIAQYDASAEEPERVRGGLPGSGAPSRRGLRAGMRRGPDPAGSPFDAALLGRGGAAAGNGTRERRGKKKK